MLLPFAVDTVCPTVASAIVSFDAVFDTVASITNPPEPDVDAGVLDTLIIPLLIVTSYFLPFTWAKCFSPPFDEESTDTVIVPTLLEFVVSTPIRKLSVLNVTLFITSSPPTVSVVIGAFPGYLVL